MINSSIITMGEKIFSKLPEGEQLIWGEEPVEKTTSKREQICLNGLWRFIPAVELCEDKPSGEWGYINVPGGWRFLIPWVPMPGIEVSGKGPAWEAFDNLKLEKGWYERSIKIPEEWKDCSIFLEQRRGISNSEVFIEGISCGSFNQLKNEIDITDAVYPGQEMVLSMLVIGGPGIQGDVFLQCRPKGAYVSDIFIKTSTRKKEIIFEVEFSRVTKVGEANFIAKIKNENGEEELRFTDVFKLDNEETQTLSYRGKWEDPRLWDVGQPNLYTLLFEIEGDNIKDEYTQTFGFRECWIEGRSFFLNGSEIRFRPVLCKDHGNVEVIDKVIDSYIDANFNLAEVWPNKEKDACWASWYECADKKGFPMTGAVGNMWEYLRTWDDPQTRKVYKTTTLVEMRAIRNHPSILMWGTNANVFGSGLGMDPRTIGVKKDHWYESFYWRKRRSEQGEKGIQIIKELDPTRGVFTHHGGGVGDVYTLNCYLNLIPLQEREEWLSHWVEYSNMPFMIVEFGTPLHVTFMRGRTDFGGAIVSEPLLTEFCTIYLGKEAYKLETEEYRLKIKEHFIENQDYKSWHVKNYFDFAPNLQKLLSLFNTNTWRSWRTMGMTGGMIPWNDGHGWGRGPQSEEMIDMGSFKPGTRGWYLREISKYQFYGFSSEGCVIHPSGKAIIKNNQPTLAWIAGSREAFTEKDHSFFTSTKVKKQIVIINDSRVTQNFSCKVEIIIDGGIINNFSYKGLIETGNTRYLPLEFMTPSDLKQMKMDGEIRLTGSIGKDKHEDVFAFRVFNKRAQTSGKVFVFDPLGKTSKMLEQLGLGVCEWQFEMDAPLVVIGCSVLSEEYSLPVAFREYVKQGGKAIIFSQQPDWIRDNLGLRVCHHVSRRVFGVDEKHPVLLDLDNTDLSDWAGESELIEAYPEYTPETTRLAKWWFPYHGYHWGNRGGVTSAAIEKPHNSSWRPILECEFDLAYSPLMELDYGNGKILLCTLDLEDHYKFDATARIILENILNYINNSSPIRKTENTILFGDNEDCLLFDEMGLEYKKQDNFNANAGLIIFGAKKIVERDVIEAYIHAGGKAFFLAGSQMYKNFNVELESMADFGGTLAVPVWDECRGISASDLRWRTKQEAQVIKAGVEVGADGLLGRFTTGDGSGVFCQINPHNFHADKNTYFRLTRWRQTRAIAQILSNMGAQFKADEIIFKPEKKRLVKLDGEWNSTLTRTMNYGIKDGQAVEEVVKSLGSWINNPFPYEQLPKVELPLVWEKHDAKWEDIGNEVVFQKIVEIPGEWVGRDLLLSLGKLDNSEDTFFNGICISRLEKRPPEPHNYPRVYTVPGELVKQEKNIISVCIYNRLERFDAMGGGGFAGPASEMFLKLKQSKGDVGFYHYDYRYDYVYGDDPYRYFNW